MGEIIYRYAEKFNIAPFIIQTILLFICFIVLAFFSPGKMGETGVVIFGIISIVVILVSRIINGKEWFKKPSNWDE